MSSEIRVLVVDDDALVRGALTMMLDGADGIRVAGEATDGDEVPALVDAHAPHVVLMDLRMPRVGGLAATKRLRERPDPPEVVVLTTFDSDENVLHALRAGASGFLLKDTPPAQIVEAVQRVAAGDPMLSPAVTRRLMEQAGADSSDRERAREALRELSEREYDVAVAIARGRSNAEIASEAYMSLSTVKAHVSHVLAKLDLENRTQIALLVHDAER
ncbi:response regulator [Actinomycetospora aeridis]|uniref:response regulator n=1 Tax=Actinomycetospora aeridis TaxID=3129231 RepID=UPI00359F9A8D